MVPSELWMLGHFSDGFHFVFVPFSYQDLYVTSIIQMPHAKYQMWPARPIFVMKYRISTNRRDTHLTQETMWCHEKSGTIDKYFEILTNIYNCLQIFPNIYKYCEKRKIVSFELWKLAFEDL